MANCGLLLSDGVSFLLLSDGASFLLLNDDSCDSEPGGGAVAPTGSGWADQLKARKRQERWEADNKRMELLGRKKSRLSMEIGELRFELGGESHPGRKRRLQEKLIAMMDSIMAIEGELQDLHIRMMQ
jgi:hypothetical protein